MAEEIRAMIIRKSAEERNNRPKTKSAPATTYSSIAVNWLKNGHETGLLVEYGPNVSHKEAFSIMCQGMWEALQDPDSFDLTPSLHFPMNPLGNPPSYAVLD